MNKKKIENWGIEFDREATQNAYANIIHKS